MTADLLPYGGTRALQVPFFFLFFSGLIVRVLVFFFFFSQKEERSFFLFLLLSVPNDPTIAGLDDLS